jgi:transcriptional regulator with XRE-family HTH domain
MYNQLLNQLLQEIDQRRKDLGMTHAVLAKRSGVGMRTVQRALSGHDANLGTVLALADALEAKLLLQGDDINKIRHKQAERKAASLVRLVQGTSALEAQAVGPIEREAAKQRTVKDLLGSRRAALWNE